MMMNDKNPLTIALVAHVDAGKTTCIESFLYHSSAIKKMGRVDHGDCMMDYDTQERNRGITITSKETSFTYNNRDFFVLDTPGHVDFVSETMRVLRVLDVAVVVISGIEGVQSHTETIVRMLENLHIPTIFFINKMDITPYSREYLKADLQSHFSDRCINLSQEGAIEEIAMCSDTLLEEYSSCKTIAKESVYQAMKERLLFPVFYGSALKNEGIRELLDFISGFQSDRLFPDRLGGICYKVSYDEQGTRLTHIKCTGGSLHVKETIGEDKIEEIRFYKGKKYEPLQELFAGQSACIKGLHHVLQGQGIGYEPDDENELSIGAMRYTIQTDKNADTKKLNEVMRQLNEEDPLLDLTVNDHGDMEVSIAGKMQQEILIQKIRDRSSIPVTFSSGRIQYMETIADTVEGAGHFEPLRHYAEVHVRLEPLERNKGIEVKDQCADTSVSLSSRSTIMHALKRIRHKGVLTGSNLTDVRIVLTVAKTHPKHTEGGDLQNAARRAVRQALMKADNRLLEPCCSFTVELPKEHLSRVLFELEKRNAKVTADAKDEQTMLVRGTGSLKALFDFKEEVIALTRGKGIFTLEGNGYEEAENPEEILETKAYDPEADFRNPPGSVFCVKGRSENVPWDLADEKMDIQLKKSNGSFGEYKRETIHVTNEDIERIIQNESGLNRNKGKVMQKKEEDHTLKNFKAKPLLPKCILIDGYNLLYTRYEDTNEEISVKRQRIEDEIFSWSATFAGRVILVFDGYQRKDNFGSSMKKGNLEVVYTKTDETADAYIEAKVAQLKNQYDITVVTSDALVQNAIFAQHAYRKSSRMFSLELDSYRKLFL